MIHPVVDGALDRAVADSVEELEHGVELLGKFQPVGICAHSLLHIAHEILAENPHLRKEVEGLVVELHAVVRDEVLKGRGGLEQGDRLRVVAGDASNIDLLEAHHQETGDLVMRGLDALHVPGGPSGVGLGLGESGELALGDLLHHDGRVGRPELFVKLKVEKEIARHSRRIPRRAPDANLLDAPRNRPELRGNLGWRAGY